MKLLASRSKPQSSKYIRSLPPDLPLLRKDYTPADVYVVPRVANRRSGETMHLDRASLHYTHAVIAGGAGAGKTSALKFLAKGAAVLSLARAHPDALPSTLPGDGLILLDDAQASHSDYLARLEQDFAKGRIWAASQDLACIPDDFAALSLQPFNEREIGAAAEAWFPGGRAVGHKGFKVVNRSAEAFVVALKANQRTRLLAATPLYLFLLLQIHAKGSTLPARRADLFDAYVSALLQAETIGRPSSSAGPAPAADADFAAQALEGIALAVKRSELAKPEHLARGYGFLRQTPNGYVEFVHPLFRDFLAARALRRNPEIDPLLEYLLDDDWREVVLFYAGLGDARALVQTLLERDRLVLAAHALAESSDVPNDLEKRVVEPLIAGAWERQDADSIAGLRALRSNSATDFFAARLKERDPSARARAAFILGQLNTDRAVEYLLPQLRDTDAGVRDQIVASLGQCTSDRVVEPLLVALRGDSRVGVVDSRMRVAAARALGEVGTEKAVPALIVDLQIGEPEVRAEAVQALIKIRSDLALKPLLAIVDSNQPQEARAAAEQVLQSI